MMFHVFLFYSSGIVLNSIYVFNCLTCNKTGCMKTRSKCHAFKYVYSDRNKTCLGVIPINHASGSFLTSLTVRPFHTVYIFNCQCICSI